MQTLKKERYTLAEYLEIDHASEKKSEFWDGHIFTLASASVNRNRIRRNCITYLQNRLRGRSCEVFPSDMRIKVPSYFSYLYADVSALCGRPIIEMLGKQEMLVNPQLIIEVLSESTAEFDRGYKFTYYKSIESFTEYILIAQDRPHVSQFIKQADNSWLNHEFNRIEDRFRLGSLECEFALTELYEEVEFSPQDNRLRLTLLSANE